jgi:predicted DNA-binding transcriptional regulator AlpA
MKTFEFELKFSLPKTSQNPDFFVERLAETGCTDALVGIGQAGRIAFHFARDANSAFEAILSAVNNIKKAIPEATLIEAAPDLVGLSDIADILGYSRQNIRKLMMSNVGSFPIPIHEGKTVLWHLSSILNWVKASNRYQVDESLLDVANTNMQLNIAKESVHVDASIQKHFLATVTPG